MWKYQQTICIENDFDRQRQRQIQTPPATHPTKCMYECMKNLILAYFRCTKEADEQQYVGENVLGLVCKIKNSHPIFGNRTLNPMMKYSSKFKDEILMHNRL